MSRFNIDFFRNIRIAIRPNLWIPNFEIASILELEGTLPLSIEGLIIDIDQTIVPSDMTVVDDRFINMLKYLKNKHRCCLLSNYRDSKTEFRRLKDIENQTAIRILKTTRKKPDPDAFRVALSFLGIHSDRVAMIGDRVLTDVLGANSVGLTTVLVKPINPKTDPLLWVQLPRFLERVLYTFFRYFSWRKTT